MHNLDFSLKRVRRRQFLSVHHNQFIFIKQKRLYCCFIDFNKDLDTVNRAKLWRKINVFGISGNMICIIRFMFEKMKTCVQTASMLSELFMSKVGLLQG